MAITSAKINLFSPFNLSHNAKSRRIASSQADLCAAIEATSTASAT